MTIKFGHILPALLMTGFASFTFASNWTYEGSTGPEHWGELGEENIACSIGKNQSPIDINVKQSFRTHPALKDTDFHYGKGIDSVINNGHTVQANYHAGSSLKVDGTVYNLKQFHFHTPSENKVDGKQYPLEMHLVHTDADNNIAVVSVLFEEGKTNPELEEVLKTLENQHGSADFDVANLLPRKTQHYRFNGSLTTPPCTEGVKWIVMKDHKTLSGKQLEQFTSAMHHNNRPVQNLNARLVIQ
ncbi:Carbonic anhydrase [Thalassocella blandensis]|nr:Carbonic anhydrase [Thalassocella blandensis]